MNNVPLVPKAWFRSSQYCVMRKTGIPNSISELVYVPENPPPGSLERRFVGAAVVVQVLNRVVAKGETDLPSAMGRQPEVKRIDSKEVRRRSTILYPKIDRSADEFRAVSRLPLLRAWTLHSGVLRIRTSD
jgi:hypothetical protein